MHDESNLHPGGDIPAGSAAAAAQVSLPPSLLYSRHHVHVCASAIVS